MQYCTTHGARYRPRSPELLPRQATRVGARAPEAPPLDPPLGSVSSFEHTKAIVTSPYHPMRNGLVERFNGTLKAMLKRLCAQQPKQWHRFIDPLLFAYREVPQQSTGFAFFELHYGRTIRGPMDKGNRYSRHEKQLSLRGGDYEKDWERP